MVRTSSPSWVQVRDEEKAEAVRTLTFRCLRQTCLPDEDLAGGNAAPIKTWDLENVSVQTASPYPTSRIL